MALPGDPVNFNQMGMGMGITGKVVEKWLHNQIMSMNQKNQKSEIFYEHRETEKRQK